MSLFRITNFDDHPDDPNWLVFRFGERAWRDEFVVELERTGISAELDDTGDPPFMVAVRQRHRSDAVRLNYLVLGRHRPMFMSHPFLRWGVLLVVLILVTLALIGWWRTTALSP